MLSLAHWPCFFLIVGHFSDLFYAEEAAIACGGYIKSALPPDSVQGKAHKLQYNRLNVHLVLPDGSLRHVTDILPNGAYSMPIYDKGNYRLKLESPDGWHFEPTEGFPVSVVHQDSCKDNYNFFFKGYAVRARVVTLGSEIGPANLVVDLFPGEKLGSDATPLSHCVTDENGSCLFASVVPGKYTLRVRVDSSQQWKFQRETIPVTVVDDVVHPEPFKITGFQVEGSVTSNGKPISGVKVHLFSTSVQPADVDFVACKCDPKAPVSPTMRIDKAGRALCQTSSDANGVFTFGLLPAGEFTIVPFYTSDNIVFDVTPTHLVFEVTRSNVNLGPSFQVSGFSPSGRVYYSVAKKAPISGAKILVNNEVMSESDASGSYTLKTMSFGEFTLQVQAEHVQFTPQQVSLTVTKPTLPDMMPSKFDVCGSITLDKMNDPSLVIGRSVQFLLNQPTNQETVMATTETRNAQGEFCALLPPGEYWVRPFVSKEEETSLGLRLAPLQIAVKVVDQPVFGLRFSQFRATLTGGIRCLEPCPTGVWEVTLKPSMQLAQQQTVTQHIKIAKSALVGEYQFVDVIPGQYELHLHPATVNHVDSASASLTSTSPGWCWKEMQISVLVEDRNIHEGLQFVQVGYQLTVVSSHNVTLHYEHVVPPPDTPPSPAPTPGTPGNVKKAAPPPPTPPPAPVLRGQWNVAPGMVQLCVPEPGEYRLRAECCHRLQQSEFTFHTSRQESQYVELNTKEHQVNVRLLLEDATEQQPQSDPITVHIEHEAGTPAEKRTIKLSKRENGEIGGDISLWLPVGGLSTRVTPQSSVYLFSPASVSVTAGVGVECLPTVATIRVERGIFVTMELRPPMEGVEVKLFSALTSDLLRTLHTDKTGKFRVGPLNSMASRQQQAPSKASQGEFRVEVAQEGYLFTEVSGGRTPEGDYHFVYQVSKLAEVVVKVVDQDTNQPLPDVLISVVGDDYRSNEHSNAQGKVVFLGLSQGVYYIRAMMKEYTFQPAGAIEVHVEEGKSVVQALMGKRTAYSIYGQITSLNREPEPGLTVEAREVGPVPGKEASPQAKQHCPAASPTHKRRIEQAITSAAGKFRLRGLMPDCQYSVSLRPESGANHVIDRTVPPGVLVSMGPEDFHNVNIVAFRRLNMMDISAYVHTSDEYLRSLYLLLYPTNNPDYILKKHSFATDSLYFVMSGLALYSTTTTRLEGDTAGREVVKYQPRSYTLRLESTLNPALFTNISAQEIVLTANSSGRGYEEKHCQFHFHPVPKLASEQEVQQNVFSMLMLPMIVLLATLCYLNWNTLSRYQKSILSKFTTSIRFPSPTMLTTRKVPHGKQDSGKELDASEIQSLNSFVVKRPGAGLSQTAAGARMNSTWFKSKK